MSGQQGTLFPSFHRKQAYEAPFPLTPTRGERGNLRQSVGQSEAVGI